MFSFIIKAKKKRKVSIKQANGVNKRLLFVTNPKKSSANSDRSIRDILNESNLITQIKRTFNPKKSELEKDHNEDINMLEDTNSKQKEIIQINNLENNSKHSCEKSSDQSHVAFTNETKLTDSEIGRSFSLASNEYSDCNQTISFTQSDLDISNFHYTYDYNNVYHMFYLMDSLILGIHI